jgi:hypothetical protein
MATHDEVVSMLTSRPGVAAEVARMGTHAPAVARLERALATGRHSPSVATLRKYVKACGKELQLRVA